MSIYGTLIHLQSYDLRAKSSLAFSEVLFISDLHILKWSEASVYESVSKV